MKHITIEQRYTISVLLKQDQRISSIARTINKDRSVVSREIKRNKDQRNGDYRFDLAQLKYEQRILNIPKHKNFTQEMRTYLDGKLRNDLSPEQIVGIAIH